MGTPEDVRGFRLLVNVVYADGTVEEVSEDRILAELDELPGAVGGIADMLRNWTPAKESGGICSARYAMKCAEQIVVHCDMSDVMDSVDEDTKQTPGVTGRETFGMFHGDGAYAGGAADDPDK